MRNFFNELKSITSGYASISYEKMPLRVADVVKMDILIADEPVIAFAKIVARRRVQEEADEAVEKLQKILPRQIVQLQDPGKSHGQDHCIAVHVRHEKGCHRISLWWRYHPEDETA